MGNIHRFAFCGSLVCLCVGISSGQFQWEARSAGQGIPASLKQIIYGNNRFLAAGGNGVFSSTDGTDWKKEDSSTAIMDFRKITYIKEKEMFFGLTNKIYSSADGITWIKRPLPKEFLVPYDITYGNGTFVVVGAAGTVCTSTDGMSWQQQTFGRGDNLTEVIHDNEKFIAISDKGNLYTSPEGAIWTQHTTDERLGSENAPVSLCYGNNVFVAAGMVPGRAGLLNKGDILTSADGITWTARSAATVFVTGVCFGDGIFVVVGNNGTIVTSADGNSWMKQNSGTTQDIGSIAFGNGVFIALGAADTLYLSRSGGTGLAIHAKAVSLPAHALKISINRTGRYVTCPFLVATYGLVDIDLYSVLGRKVCAERVAVCDGKIALPLAGLSAGIYILSINKTESKPVQNAFSITK